MIYSDTYLDYYIVSPTMVRGSNVRVDKAVAEKTENEIREAFLTLMQKLPGRLPGFGRTGWKDGDELLVLLSAIEYIRDLERRLGLSQEETEAY